MSVTKKNKVELKVGKFYHDKRDHFWSAVFRRSDSGVILLAGWEDTVGEINKDINVTLRDLKDLLNLRDEVQEVVDYIEKHG